MYNGYNCSIGLVVAYLSTQPLERFFRVLQWKA